VDLTQHQALRRRRRHGSVQRHAAQKGGFKGMRRLASFSLGALLLALVTISATAQTQARVTSGQPVPDERGRIFHPKSTRAVTSTSAVFTKQAAPLPDNTVFSASPRTSGDRASIVKTQTTANSQSTPFWPQWALDQQHSGQVNVEGQSLDQILAAVTYDALVADEEGQNGGNLLAHFQVPLIDGNDVYMESKDGSYTINTYSTERWHQNKFTWQHGNLVKLWTFDTDWIAPGSAFDFWEPVYHAALANGFVYDMGAGGTLFKLNKNNGHVVKRLNPFGNTVDPNKFTASPPSVDSNGNVYYNVVQIVDNTQDFYSSDVVNSWLVKVRPDDSISKVTYTTLLSQATIKGEAVPAGTAQCEVAFSSTLLPWPPSPNAVPGTTTCGTQRAGLNVAPAIASDGTVYTVSRGHFVTRYNYLIAVNPNLTGKWAASLRGRLHDGCTDGTVSGSVLPVNGQPGGCRVGSNNGVDPEVNHAGPGRVLDDESSTPTVAPDGSILFGAYTRYNYAQGHLFQFSANGNFLHSFGFGWDSTPALFSHEDSYSIVIKNNHYSGLGSYCNDPNFCPTDRTATNPASPEAYFVTQLSRNLNIEWSFQNTNTESCTRNPDGTITCVNDHPHGFEWCVNAPVVDEEGIVYANSEDGNLYSINQGGTMRQRLFQQQAIGAAYTPASIGPDGKIYSENQGILFVVGSGHTASNGWKGVFRPGIGGGR